MKDAERVTRGNLPHWYKPGHAHFVTYRLANSIPLHRLSDWKEERERRLERPTPDGFTHSKHREHAHKIFYKRYDNYLDKNPNVRWLEQDAVAQVVKDNLYHHHGKLYELLAWCIMPNHVHILIQPFEFATDVIASYDNNSNYDSNENSPSDEFGDQSSVLSRIMHSLKSYTANRANQVLLRRGGFWQSESYDHWVRDLDELERIVEYIRLNPVAAGLCNHAREWKFSSAYDRYREDRSESGLVGWLRDDWRRSDVCGSSNDAGSVGHVEVANLDSSAPAAASIRRNQDNQHPK